MKTISKSQLFKEQVLRDGYVPLHNEGYFYVVDQISTKNFNNMGKMFIEQLKKEGKYNSYIGFLSPNATPPHSVEMLPIYGSGDRYVTKWFRDTAEKCINEDLKCKELCLLKRAVLKSAAEEE